MDQTGIRLLLAELKPPVHDLLERGGYLAALGTGRVFDIYELSGMETSNAAVNSGSAIGTAAAGAMGTTQTAFLNDGYQLVLDLLNRGEIGDRLATSMNVKSGYSYFNATVGLLMLLTMSGAFQAW